MVIAILQAWVFQVLPVFVATTFLGASEVAVWWIMAFSGVVSALGFFWYYRRGRWLTVTV